MGRNIRRIQEIEYQRVQEEMDILKMHSLERIKELELKPKRSKKTSGQEVLKSIPYLKLLEDFWIKDINDWKCKTYNLERKKIDLIKFLLVKYKVPNFLYSIFNNHYDKNPGNYTSDMLLLFVDLAQGNSPRYILKNYLSKSESKIFLNSKDDDIIKSIWVSKSESYKLDVKISNAILSKNIDIIYQLYFKRKIDKDAIKFWESVLLFFARYNGKLAPVDIIDLSDYIRTLPNIFSFKGRTLKSVMTLSSQWHKDIIKSRGAPKELDVWSGLKINNWSGIVKHNKIDNPWSITQIKNNVDLYNEGKNQCHCVFSYKGACKTGHTAIFSLKNLDQRSCTIEVNNSYQVGQIRGKRNRKATDEEMSVIKIWAKKNHLKINPHGFWGFR